MQSASSAEPILLSTSLDFLAAGPLCTQLRERLNATPSVELIGDKVERVSTACLQLIVCASASARQRGGAVTLKSPSPVLSQALLDLGLTQSLLA